jgi:hypothetical protein
MKFLSEVIVTLFLIYGTLSDAVGADWVSVYSRSGVNFYYDRDSVTSNSMRKIELETKTVFESDTIRQKIIKERRDKGLSAGGWDKLRFIVNRVEIDCLSRNYNFLSGNHYDEVGNLLAAENESTVQWNPIIDNSPMMFTYNAVCRTLKR